MERVQLAIVYTPDGGKPYRVVAVEDRDLLQQAAQTAVREAEDRAAILRPADEFLSCVETAEASRLKQVLGMIIPGFHEHATARVM